MALKMRPTGLGSGFYEDNVDYGIYCGEWCIGRIYETRTGPESLRRPGGNATGFTIFEYNISGKWLGRVDGFNQDEAECQGYEGSVVLRGLLASERDAFEALEFADGLLDACPRLVEYFRKECRSIDRV